MRGRGHHVRRTGAGVLTLTGDKSRAIAAARAAGVPTLKSVAPGTDVAALVQEAAALRFPSS